MKRAFETVSAAAIFLTLMAMGVFSAEEAKASEALTWKSPAVLALASTSRVGPVARDRNAGAVLSEARNALRIQDRRRDTRHKLRPADDGSVASKSVSSKKSKKSNRVLILGGPEVIPM